MSINLERAKCCILEGFGSCISSWCCKNGIDFELIFLFEIDQ